MPDIPIITDVQFFTSFFKRRGLIHIPARKFSSITFRKSGRVLVRCGEIEFISEPNSLTFMPKGCAYDTQILEDGEMSILHFHTLEESDRFLDAPISVRPQFPLAFSNLFGNALERFASSGCDLFSMSAAYELLNEAKSIFESNSPSPPRRMKKCKQYIDDNICDSSLRISALAEMCGISEVYFRREFKKFYGTSPLDYIKKRRIEIARGLLQTGMCNVTDTAFQSGFESISYFSAEFRRLTGMSPGEYINTKR